MTENNGKFRYVRLLGIVQADTAIVHGSGGKETRDGKKIDMAIKRKVVADNNSGSSFVPVVSGNAIRGGALRDSATLRLATKLGVFKSIIDFRLYASGGTAATMISKEKGGYKYIDLAREIELRRKNPHLSTFGGQKHSLIKGKLRVGDMLPICKATKHLMPDYFGSNEEISFLSEIPEDEILFTRRQKEEDPAWQEYLAEEALAEMAQEAEKAEKRDAAKLKKERIENKKKGKENNVPNEEQEETLDEEETLLSEEAKKSVKMIRTVEAIPAGTKMYNFIDLVRPSKIEIGLICAALEEFSISPYVGGKSSQGYGRVSMSYNLVVDGNMSNMEDQAVVINQNEIFTLNSPLLQECLAAYEEWLANVKREDVLYYEFEKKGKNKGE